MLNDKNEMSNVKYQMLNVNNVKYFVGVYLRRSSGNFLARYHNHIYLYSDLFNEKEDVSEEQPDGQHLSEYDIQVYPHHEYVHHLYHLCCIQNMFSFAKIKS